MKIEACWKTTATSGNDTWKSDRERIDLATVATGLLGPAPKRDGRRLWWSCPLGTHEDRTPSFAVEVDKLGGYGKCFGCGERVDAAELVMRTRHVGFVEAKAYLLGGPTPKERTRSHSPQTVRRSPVPDEPTPEPDGLTADQAAELVSASAARLESPEGSKALAYLMGPQRGLTIETIRTRRLGWTACTSVPKGDHFCPVRGIVISWYVGNTLALVKVRQPDGFRPKYREVYRDRRRHVGIYPSPEAVRPGRPLILTEGEFDAILLSQELGALAPVATLGSASARPEPAILVRLLAAAPWFVATDNDAAGDGAAEKWEAFPRARRVRPPSPHKDWTEAKLGFRPGFGVNLRRWWGEILAGAERPALYAWEELETWRWGPAVGDPTPGIIVN